MKTKISLALIVSILAMFFLSCEKEQIVEKGADPSTVELATKANKWPRVRFKYNYDAIPGCSGGECGSCVGVCIFVPIKFGPKPTGGELAQGFGRVQLKVISGNVEFTPLDLPMDPGTGKTILDSVLKTETDVANSLGYSKVELLPGTYSVDYSGGTTYGRILVPATLVP